MKQSMDKLSLDTAGETKLGVPRVSILMGIYNCVTTLREAVISIQSQTYDDWELIMCDDGSTDTTYNLAVELASQDGRIVILKNTQNQGLATTLDKCAKCARGEYFARMDGDDVSHPLRLTKLVKALDENPWAAVVSSWMTCFDEHGPWGLVKTLPRPEIIDHLYDAPYCHAPCMMRRSAFETVGGYGDSPWIKRVEDRNLWFKFARAGLKGLNLQESLYSMRDDRAAAGRRTLRARINGVFVRWRGMGWLNFPLWSRVYALQPLATWLIPGFIYRYIRRRRLQANIAT